jgi:hypothetical protein
MRRRFWPKFDPASMSARARGYLMVAFFHFGIVGAEILIRPHHYSANAFVAIVRYDYLAAWGISYCVVAVLCLVAAITRWPSFARGGLSAAVVVLLVSSAAVLWGVILSWIDPNRTPASLVVPVTLAALACKDWLMVGQPLRTPTEDQTNARAELDAS